MSSSIRTCTVGCVAWVLCSTAFGATSLIPKPVAITETGGDPFVVDAQTVIVAAKPLENEANYLRKALAVPIGFDLKTATTGGGENRIVLKLGGSLEPEGYTLRSDANTITIEGTDAAGVFYGIQTLRGLLPPDVYGQKQAGGVEWTVPAVEITDYPRFAWRGLLIDPARHFIPVDDVKRFIDLLAMHKFNRLQMHLSDNIGWRVEIRKHPDLTRLASSRDRSGGNGGFYTQAQVRDFVAYAAARHITIVPEIEMPYHAGAAINAYPRLGINPARVAGMSIDERWGKLGGLVAPRPATVTFMQEVLGEIIELFPSRFIHIGGDEANLRLWQNDPEMQAQMKQFGCRDAHELHSWFIKQIDAFLTKRGRRMVGWDEILQGGLAPGATVMSWRGVNGGITAAKAGHDVVMAPTSHTYFDYRQHPDELGLGRSVITLEKVYAFEPIPDALSAEEAKHVLGGQGQLWGELIPDEERREFMAYPRGCALIEVLWSPKEGRRWEEFLPRMREHRKRLKAAEVNYRPLDAASPADSATDGRPKAGVHRSLGHRPRDSDARTRPSWPKAMLTAAAIGEYGLRPNGLVLARFPGALPRATVNVGLRPTDRRPVTSTLCLSSPVPSPQPPAPLVERTRLALACTPQNDLYRVLVDSGVACKRFDTPADAVQAVERGGGVLILADGYPQQATAIEPSVWTKANEKRLRLYVECPAALPGIDVGKPISTHVERVVVNSDFFGDGLAKLRIVSVNGLQYLPVTAKRSHLVAARVAGFDHAVYGLHEKTLPILFEMPDGNVLVATTGLSRFVTGRYSPQDSWRTIWRAILSWVAPQTELPPLKWTPTVRATYARDERLPEDYQLQTITRALVLCHT